MTYEKSNNDSNDFNNDPVGLGMGEIVVTTSFHHNNVKENITHNDEEDGFSSQKSGSSFWGGDDQSTSNETGCYSSPNTVNDSTRFNSTVGGHVTEESLNIAKKENRLVRTWRVIMFGVLLVTTIVVAVLVFSFVSNMERVEFETSFEDDTIKIYESLRTSMDTKLEAVDSLAMLMVSSARERNETWPYTVLPDFASKAAKMRILSNAIALQQYQYVTEENRVDWERFAKSNEGWVQDAIDVVRTDTTFRGPNKETIEDYPNPNDYDERIRYGGPVENNTGPYTPSWQTYPMLQSPNITAYNFNAIQHKTLGPGIREVFQNRRVVIGPVLNFEDSKEDGGNNRVTVWAARHVSDDVDASEPVIRVLYPILDTASGAITIDQGESSSNVVGIIASSFFWRSFLENILPNGEDGVTVVFENTCNQSFTYEVNGYEATWIGPGDLHDPKFDYLGHTVTFEDMGFYYSESSRRERNYGGLPINDDYCAYTVSTYPSQTMKDKHITNNPFVFTVVSVAIFVFTVVVFIGYDKLVARRQRKVMKTAVRSSTIVSSLFPSTVRDRLMEDSNSNRVHKNTTSSGSGYMAGSVLATKSRLRTFLNDGSDPSSSEFAITKRNNNTAELNKPIADLFTETTVMFADIAGFTAWSSVREPTQVFTLLETVYGAFDAIALRRGVFKVETIGDSYVAVTGLPDPRKDHAVAMAKFARDCRQKFRELVSILESSLGPETGDLNLRIGLHSGPVTAGVLRGQKSRFQLFGDTVNTAARMESTGKVNKIQISESTAALLKSAKKSHWITPREEMVEAKGKGLLRTYWVEPKIVTASSTDTNTTSSLSGFLPFNQSTSVSSPRVSNQMERLINWNIDVLERLLKKIVARRIALGKIITVVNVDWDRTSDDTIVLNEVKEVIELPEYDSNYAQADDPDSIVLQSRVRLQLRDLITSIALTYHDNPFHNFAHASHVCMSVAKLLSRIVAPDKDFEEQEQLHDHTYGITSDPLTQFACVFSALIHDADHPGVPNAQLVKEKTDMAKTYHGKSIAEQNSINVAWKILVDDKYKELRGTICGSQQEENRFRHLIVNAVCATDIIDKDLKLARNQRWDKAFSTKTATSSLLLTSKRENEQVQINRKATIVIEHIIQASDIAHTMQHWHVYIKWNERLYAEMYKAYTDGRSEKDPTDSWYEGEIGFFDFYIIPLAQKLSECGVFGVSSDEYLNYATMNRNEWEKKGRDVVSNYIKKYKNKDGHRCSGA